MKKDTPTKTKIKMKTNDLKPGQFVLCTKNLMFENGDCSFSAGKEYEILSVHGEHSLDLKDNQWYEDNIRHTVQDDWLECFVLPNKKSPL